MRKIGIIGAGNMGSGIAQKTSQEGLSVVIVDVKEEFVQKGMGRIRSSLEEAVERNILKSYQVNEILGRLKSTTNMEDVADCDLVIEAVFEDLNVKKNLFKRLDSICNEKTVLATNTSSFFVDDLAWVTKRPDRVVGLHFFYHPAKNRLLEIIPGDLTSPETLSFCKKYSKLIGKTDIQVKDAPGFAINRFFMPYINEAVRVLDDGIANIPTIETAVMNCFGIDMGPFRLMNVTGIPVNYHTQKTLYEKLGAFYEVAEGLINQFESGKQWNLEGDVEEDKIDHVCDRLLGCVFYTTTSLVEEGIAEITDIDVGAKVGLRWKKGPFEIMNDMGIDNACKLVVETLKYFKNLSLPEVLKAQRDKGKPWDIRYIKYTSEKGTANISISRPDALNALNKTMIDQIEEAFREAGADPDTEAIVIDAAGKAFIAGADIKFFVDSIKAGKLSDIYDFTAYGQEVLNRIDDSKKPVIVKMEGLALGGGLELALSADIIVATPKARMGFPETGIGIYPGFGGTQRSSRFIGKELTKYLVFTNQIISAKDAHDIGLIDYICEPDEIDQMVQDLIEKGEFSPNKGRKDRALPEEWKKIRALFIDTKIENWLSGKFLGEDDRIETKIARIIASKAPLALKLANEIIDSGFGKPLKEGLKDELDHIVEIFATKDALTGLSGTGKKDIRFEGK